jgi:hypothetical protein
MKKASIPDIQRKFKVFKYTAGIENISKACKHFGISTNGKDVIKKIAIKA